MAQNSYRKIELTSNIELHWPFSYTGTYVVCDFNDIDPNAGGHKIKLPDATLASPGQNFVFNNISLYSFDVIYNGGDELVTIAAGEVRQFYLYDASTQDGLWRVIPYGSGTSAISALEVTSSDSSIVITDGDVTPPGGIIDFTLPESLSAVNKLSTTGFAYLTKTGSDLTWSNVTLTAGDNITITNPISPNNFNISVSDTIDNITSLTIDPLIIESGVITTVGDNENIQIATSGTGKVQINGVEIDANGNLTVSGTFSTPLLPKAYCNFTDIVAGSDHTIAIQDNVNVSAVNRQGNGVYKIVFETPFASSGDNDYGVIITLGSGGDPLPYVSHGFYVERNQAYVIIAVTDASGELVSSLPYGATVMIMSSKELG